MLFFLLVGFQFRNLGLFEVIKVVRVEDRVEEFIEDNRVFEVVVGSDLEGIVEIRVVIVQFGKELEIVIVRGKSC